MKRPIPPAASTKRFLASFLMATAALFFGAFAAQPNSVATIETDGTLDTTFDAGVFTNGQVWSSALQADGKLLIGGQFSKVHGVTRLGLARLNTDGTLDTSFDPGDTSTFDADTIAIQADGKILVQSSLAGVSLARLNSDGSADASFSPPRTLSYDGASDSAGNATDPGRADALILQPDGKIVVVGRFRFVITGPGQSAFRGGIARFNPDGSLDGSFAPGNGFNDPLDGTFEPTPSHAVVQSTGKIIVQGNFSTYADDSVSGLVRINTDGSRDATFNPGSASGNFPSFVTGLFVQGDDKIVLFGSFTSFSGVVNNGIVRLDAGTGSIDGGFNTAAFQDYYDTGTIWSVTQQPDGKLLVGGTFHSLGGVLGNNVVRLESTGARDNSFGGFAAGPLASNVTSLLVRPSDGKIFVGGYFSRYGDAPRGNMAWANSDGSVDSTFEGLSGATDQVPQAYTIAPQPDGKILVGGFFSSVNGVPHNNLVRLNSDSTIDSSFVADIYGSLRAILVQPDGKIVVAGNIRAVNGVARGRIARLNSDGSLDTSFDPGTGASSTIMALTADATGSFFIGGAFTTYNGFGMSRLAKLTPSGALDTTFKVGAPTGTVNAITPPDSNGYITIGGTFQRVGTTTVRNIAHIGPTGTLDQSFNSGGFGFNGTVRAVLRAPDGKFYVAGAFTFYNNSVRSEIVRLNSNGSIDSTFIPPSNVTGASMGALVLQDGKIIVGGGTNPNLPGLVRLTDTGAYDSSLAVGTTFQVTPSTTYQTRFGALTALALDAEGRLLVGGIFNQYNGTPRTALARLTGPTVSPTPTPTATVAPTATPAATPTATPTGTATATPGATASPTPAATATPPAGNVGNVSTRLPVGTGDNVLIEGFIVQGPPGSTKKIIVRAVGPSLIPFGIADALPNPTLEIRDAGGALVATNNDWKTTQVGGLITADQFAEISNSGVAPSNDLESAIIANLAPGSYTAVVSGFGNTTGTGVVDAYDISAASPMKLANIATRGLIQAGDKLMIAGFIVQDAPVKAVLRAIGPSLLAFGISNALPDTALQLRDQNGQVILENDDWQSDAQQAQELQTIGLQPSHDLEAALITTIQPGQYTAQVRGKNDASGIGVVQVYFLQ